MGKRIFPEERRNLVAALVSSRRLVSVAELSAKCGVSQATIRTDLDELESRGVLVRTHGGAVAVTPNISELSFATREQMQVQEKNRIGQVAARMIRDGDAIALDASTTALAIAKQIKDRSELTVITNGIRVALELFAAPGVTVVMPGGFLRREAISLVGELGQEVLTRFNVQKGFFGARGITLEEGLTDINNDEVHSKAAIVRAAKEVIATVDHTKWGRVAFASFASIDQVDKVITDDKAPPDLVAALRQRGVEVVLV